MSTTRVASRSSSSNRNKIGAPRLPGCSGLISKSHKAYQLKLRESTWAIRGMTRYGMAAFEVINGLGWITGRLPLITDCIEKVENDAAAKISQKSGRSELWHEKPSWPR